MAVGQARVVSHGFLFLLITAAIFYLALSARNMAPALPGPRETAYSFYTGGYLLRPAAGPRSLGVQSAPGGEVLRVVAAGAQAVSGPGGAGLVQGASSEALTPDRGLVSYEVAKGDTLSGLAERFGISVDTILWANDLRNADFIRIGQSLVVLPVSGILHTVQKGDTLLSLAARYGVTGEDILGYKPNNISDADSLAIGQQLIIPEGTMPVARAVASSRGGTRLEVSASQPASQAQASSGRLAWPIWGPIFQYFSAGHRGIDISPPYGTPVRAADGGVVVKAERLNWGLGWNLTVDHGGGISTVYAHLSRFEVWTGDVVAQGEVVGLVGTTGYVTGPHLHFEVHRNGVPINPLGLLP